MVEMLSPDGFVEAYSPLSGNCCPPKICELNPEAMECAFVGYLPNGPMWDYWKQIGQSGGDVSCASLVNYSRFAGRRLYEVMIATIWPAMREGDPETAVTSLDSWLERMRWIDCYGACRDKNLTALSPLEVMTPCGPEYCGVVFDPNFDLAYKSALVRALWRMRMGIVGNIDSINWVLEPLCAMVSPDPANADFLDCACDREKLCLVISPTCRELRVPQEECGADDVFVPAWIDFGCDRPAGLPETAWPALLAAECIVRSLLPRRRLCIINLNCAEPETESG